MRPISALTLAMALGVTSLPAIAMPVGNPSVRDGSIVEVDYGCGWGWTRQPWGGCAPRRGLYGCPPGWHLGPQGVYCWRNHGRGRGY